MKALFKSAFNFISDPRSLTVLGAGVGTVVAVTGSSVVAIAGGMTVAIVSGLVAYKLS